MWKFSYFFALIVIISSLSVNDAAIKSIRDVTMNCASENVNIEYLSCNFTDISSSSDQLKIISSNMDLIKERLNQFYVNIDGTENYPERLPKNLGKSINGTTGFRYFNSPLKYINRKDFKDMSPNLGFIILKFNKIEEIAYDTFHDLPNLRYLDLRNNSLKSLASNLLQYAPIITTLMIESNKIEELHPDLFKNCPEFHVLYAEFNNMSDVHEDLFKNNPKMTIISIRHNKIRNVLTDFTRFKELEVADFTNNYGTCDTMYSRSEPDNENEQKKWITNVADFQKMIVETCRNV